MMDVGSNQKLAFPVSQSAAEVRTDMPIRSLLSPPLGYAVAGRCARRLPSFNIDLRETKGERLPWNDASFDIVVTCSVFHYI
jgi:hypothetical protein